MLQIGILDTPVTSGLAENENQRHSKRLQRLFGGKAAEVPKAAIDFRRDVTRLLHFKSSKDPGSGKSSVVTALVDSASSDEPWMLMGHTSKKQAMSSISCAVASKVHKSSSSAGAGSLDLHEEVCSGFPIWIARARCEVVD